MASRTNHSATTAYSARQILSVRSRKALICAKPVSKFVLLANVAGSVGVEVRLITASFLGDAGRIVELFVAAVAFAAAAAEGLSGVGRTCGGVLGGLRIASKGLTYTDTGRFEAGPRTGGSGAGAAGGLPILAPTPLRIQGQRSVSVRFGGGHLLSCVLVVGAFGFSSSLELELCAPADVPRESLIL